MRTESEDYPYGRLYFEVGLYRGGIGSCTERKDNSYILHVDLKTTTRVTRTEFACIMGWIMESKRWRPGSMYLLKQKLLQNMTKSQ